MTIFLTLYITDSLNLPSATIFAQMLHAKYGIRSCMMTTSQVSKFMNNRLPIGFSVVDNLSDSIHDMIRCNLTAVLSDSNVHIKREEIMTGSISFLQQSLFFDGVSYKVSNPEDIDKFVVYLTKVKSKTTNSFVYHDTIYSFTSDMDCQNFACVPVAINLSLTNQMPIVHLEWNFTNSEVMCQKWDHLTEKVQLSSQINKQVTHYVVTNCTSQATPHERTIYFCMEPMGERLYGHYIQSLVKPMFLGTHDRHLNNLEWHLAWNLSELRKNPIVKTFDKALTVVVSSKNHDPGHKYRLALIDRLDKHPNLPFQLLIYGMCQSLNFRNYRGELPDQEKDQALFPFKYHLNVENQYIPNYITEKLADATCAETLLFYYGCPNVNHYFDPQGFVSLSGNMDRLDEDVKLISDVIVNNEYDKRLPSIRANKEKILTQYSFEPRVLSIIAINPTVAFASTETVSKHLQAEGFVNTSLAGTQTLEKMILQSMSKFAPLLLIRSERIIELIFDTCCFWWSKHQEDMHAIAWDKDCKDIFILPSGVEIVHKNLTAHNPYPFDKLKIWFVEH